MVSSFPRVCTLLLHLKSFLPVLPTSVLAPKHGFNLTQMIRSKLQQHHPDTSILSAHPS